MTRLCVPEMPSWIMKPMEKISVSRDDMVFLAANATQEGRPYYLFTTRMAVTYGDWQTCKNALDAINAEGTLQEFGQATFPTSRGMHLNELMLLYENRDRITLRSDQSYWGECANGCAAETVAGNGHQKIVSCDNINGLFPVFRRYIPMG